MKRRKAVTLGLACNAPTDREKIWAAIRQEKIFSQVQIATLAVCDKGKVQDYLKGLMAAGYVRKLSVKPFNTAIYELLKDSGVDAPRLRKDGTPLPQSGRTRMWNAMRVLQAFTLDELMAAASLPEAPVAFEEARTYCGWLVRGGYLVHSGENYRFIPAKFSGARAPQVLRVKKLFDPNLGAVVAESAPEGRDDE